MRYYLYLDQRDRKDIRSMVSKIANHYISNNSSYPEYRAYMTIGDDFEVVVSEQNDYVRVSLHLRKRYDVYTGFKRKYEKLNVYVDKILGERPQTNEEVVNRFREILKEIACYYIYYFETGLDQIPKDLNSTARWNSVKHPVFSCNVKDRAKEFVVKILGHDNEVEGGNDDETMLYANL